MNATLQPLLINVVKAAELLSLSDRTVRQLAKDGKLPCVRIGSRLLFVPADLVQWVQAQRTPAITAISASPRAEPHDGQRNGDGFDTGLD